MKLSAKDLIDAGCGGIIYKHIDGLNLMNDEHTHDYFEIFYVAYGSVVHQINGRSEQLTREDAILIRPEDSHCYKRLAGGSIVNIAFLRTVMDKLFTFTGTEAFKERLLLAPSPPKAHLPAAVCGLMQNLFLTLPPLDTKLQAAQLLSICSLLFTSILSGDVSAEPKAPQWLSALCRRMEQIEEFTLGVRRLYALSPKTPEHTARAFRRYLSKTPGEYVASLKISYAKKLFATTDSQVVDVAFEAGFESLSNFYTQFSKQVGMPPAAYKSSVYKLL